MDWFDSPRFAVLPALVATTGLAIAQSGGHPTFADPINPIPQSLLSPFVNAPDGQWNFGESASAVVDQGGVINHDTDPAAAVNQVNELQGWTSMGNGLRHYIGELRPTGLPIDPREPSESAASFEIVVSDNFGQYDDTVLVVSTRQTSSSSIAERRRLDPFVYPGDTTPGKFGLWTDALGNFDRPWPPAHVMVSTLEADPEVNFNVAGAYIVPRVAGAPLSFTVQRNRQIREVAMHLLDLEYGPGAQTPTSYTKARTAVMVGGGSFGGFMTQILVLLYPTEFHAGVVSGYGANKRGVINDQSAITFFGAHTGRKFSGDGYHVGLQANYPTFLNQVTRDPVNGPFGTDYLSLSTVNRIRRGELERPMYFLAGDEDPVTHGDLWAWPLDPNAADFQANGSVALTPAATVWWGIRGKACHTSDNEFGGPYFVGGDASNLETESHDPTDAALFIAKAAVLQLNAPALSFPQPDLKVPLFQGPVNALVTLDPHDHVLGRNEFRKGTVPTPVGGSSSYLAENSTFQRHGHGAWLGASDSLVVARHSPGIPPFQDSVYVGSADGSVTRFMVLSQSEPPPVSQPEQISVHPLMEIARSNDNGVDYAPGYGTWGLDVGDLAPLGSNEVVVCSYGRIAVLCAISMELLRERAAPLGSADAWLYTQPRRIEVHDVYAPLPGDEIVLTTLHGHIVVLDKDLNVIAEHTEGGVADILVGPTAPMLLGSNSLLTKPIYCLSGRGHLFSLEMDATLSPPSTDMGRLTALSPLQYGSMHDLEEVVWQDPVTLQNRFAVAALYTQHPGETLSPVGNRSIRIFDPDTLELWTEFGDVHKPVAPQPPDGYEPEDVAIPKAIDGLEPSLAIAVDSQQKQHFVVAYNEQLIVWDDSGAENYVGLKEVDTFTPAKGMTSVAAGDLHPSLPGDEVVVSTLSGRLAWFTLTELMEGAPIQNRAFSIPRRAGMASQAPTVFVDDRTNPTLGGTWGLALHPVENKLHAIDQSGTWWRVDPDTGYPALVGELDNSIPPVSNLVWSGVNSLGEGSPPGSGVNHWEIENTSAGYAVESTPYLPIDTERNVWLVPPSPIRTGLMKDGFWVCPNGGHAATAPTGDTYAAWWAWGLGYGNMVQMVRYDSAGIMQSLWSSTGPDLTPNHPPKPSLKQPTFGIALRNESAVPAEFYDLQSLRVGRVHGDSTRTTPQAVVGSAGGRVFLLDGDTGAILDESEDYGYGGMALTLHNLDTDAELEVLFAPCYSQASRNSGHLQSSLYVLDHDGVGGNGNPNESGFVEIASHLLSDNLEINPTLLHDFPGYGACAIAVADIDADTKDEIVVTTVNGELIVFEWDSGTLSPEHYRRVEGALGMFNSIVLADLSSVNGAKMEIYVAGTSGIHRFDVQ